MKGASDCCCCDVPSAVSLAALGEVDLAAPSKDDMGRLGLGTDAGAAGACSGAPRPVMEGAVEALLANPEGEARLEAAGGAGDSSSEGTAAAAGAGAGAGVDGAATAAGAGVAGTGTAGMAGV